MTKGDVALKILFVVPPYHLIYSAVPQGIGIVATVAKAKGFDVQIFMADPNEQFLSFHKKVVNEVIKQQIDVVAIGGHSMNYSSIQQLITLIKKTGALTVLGGFIVDSSPVIVPANIGADYCVYGEGEYTFVELMYALQNNVDVREVNGLIYLHEDELITTPPRPCVSNLDDLPFIDSDLCHFDISLKHEPTLILSLSRSCPYKCTFCYHVTGSRYRAKSLDYFFHELDYYTSKHGSKVEQLFIQDEMFSADKDRLLQFCDRIKKYKYPFRVQTRVDCVDEECIIALKDAGVARLSFGLESANNRVLASMRKSYTIEQAEKTLKLAHKHGVAIGALLIIGDIEDDLDTIRDSEEFFHKYAYKYDISIHMIRVFPGTHLYINAVKRGIINDELEFLQKGCPLVNVSKIPNDVYSLLNDKYHAYATSKSMITRRPLENDNLEFSVDKNGLMTYVCYCPKCYSKVIVNEKLRIRYTAMLLLCQNCCQILDTALMRSKLFNYPDTYLLRNFVNKYFNEYIGSKVVIWGVTYAIKRLISVSQILRDVVVKIVDINHHKFHHNTFCGLSVENPDTLKEVEFDYILTPVIERRQELIDTLELWGIQPKFIDITAIVQ